MGAVRRVDVHQDHADLRSRILHQRPLGVVGAPQPKAVAFLQSEPKQPAGKAPNPLVKHSIGPTDILMTRHERLALGKRVGDTSEICRDGLV